MKKNLTSLISVLIMVVIFSANAFSQTTEFTYQGSLKNAAAPANGNYDFEFALYDAVSGGAQVGLTLTRSSVAVVNGIFAVTLDFGAATLPGANRFLDIAVRTAGGGAFTPLAPRQPVTSAPYAIRSLNSTTADAVSVAGVPAGSGNYVQNGVAVQSSSNFNISGNGTAGGTLSGNDVNTATQYNIGGSKVLTVAGQNNIYAGLGSGYVPFFSSNNSFFGANSGESNIGVNNSFVGSSAGRGNGEGGNNSFFGKDAGFNNYNASFNTFIGSSAGYSNHGFVSLGENNTFVGSSSGTANTLGNNNTIIGATANLGFDNLLNATAIGFGAIVSQSNSLVLGNNARVGIGTSLPTYKLEINELADKGLRVATGTVDGTVASFGGRGAFVIDAENIVGGRLSVNQNGNVGIGTAAPAQKLDVTGNIRIGTGITGCVEDRDGTVIAGACFSDLRFKRDITPFGGILNSFSTLRPVNFYWRRDEFADKHFGTKRSFGLIAQEVEQAFPDLVSTDEQGYKVVNYSKLPLLTIQAVNEQQKQIENQKQEIDSQKAQLAAQQRQIDAMKRILCRLDPTAEICKETEK